jgi:regulator of replication initiation timing
VTVTQAAEEIMAGNDAALPGDASRVFLEHLERQGFFQQIKDLESNLKLIANELSTFAKSAAARLEETESLAAHLLALQAIVTVLLRHTPLSDDEVQKEVKTRTAQLTGNPEGSPTVQSVAADLLAAARR